MDNYTETDLDIGIAVNEAAIHSIRYRGLNLSINRTNIETEYISRKSAQKIYNAYDFAKYMNWPMNYRVFIHLKDGVCQSSNTAFAKIRRKYNICFNYHKKREGYTTPPTYVYSFENPNNNVHVNWCLHIPDRFEEIFLRKIKHWVSKVQGQLKPETIYLDKINPDAYKAPANYMLKGVSPEDAERFHLTELQEKKGPQGLIYGKRAGFSQSIGVTAQRNADFIPTDYRRARMIERRAA